MTRDVFRPLSDAEREEKLRAYGDFLRTRDGVPDLAKRTLSRREEKLQRFQEAKILYQGVVDQALFEAQYRRFDKRLPTPKEMLLLLTFIKFNDAEAYAVEKAFRALEQGSLTLKSELDLFKLLEEHYHTKLLLTAANLFGLEVKPRFDAPVAVKILTAVTLHLPDFLMRSLDFASECISVFGMSRLLQSLHNVFPAPSPLRDAMEERLIEVLIDEIGHVSYTRLQLDSRGLAQAKVFLPIVALGLSRGIGEAHVLGICPIPWRGVFSFEIEQLPEEIRRRAFIV